WRGLAGEHCACLHAVSAYWPWYHAAPLREIFQTPGHQGRPAGLVTRPQAAASFAVEIFMKQHQFAPVRVGGETPVVAMAGAPTMLVRQKEPGQAGGEFTRHLLQVHPAS